MQSASACQSRPRLCRPRLERHTPAPLGVEPNRLVAVGDRLVVIALAAADVAASGVYGDVFRIESDRLRVVGQRPIIVSLGIVGPPAIAVRSARLRVKSDRLGEFGDGSIEVAAIQVSFSAIAVGRCQVRAGTARVGGDQVRTGLKGVPPTMQSGKAF